MLLLVVGGVVVVGGGVLCCRSNHKPSGGERHHWTVHVIFDGYPCQPITDNADLCCVSSAQRSYLRRGPWPSCVHCYVDRRVVKFMDEADLRGRFFGY